MCGSSGGREEQQGRGRRKEEGPSAPHGTAHPAPCRPRVTLARMSMVVQVSISCMDTGVCPSALPSRISTSCSAFSLNVSIKLTKELGKSTQISGQRDRPRAAAAPRPTLWGEASVWSGSGGLSQPFWSPLEAQLTCWGCSNQTKPCGFTIPLHSGWPLSLSPCPNGSLGPPSATGFLNSELKGMWLCENFRGQQEGREERPLGPPEPMKVSLQPLCWHCPLSFPALPRAAICSLLFSHLMPCL